MEVALGQLIKEERQQIQYRWLDQLQRDFPNADKLEPAILQDGMPDYLDALADMFQTEGGAWLERTHEAWSKVAREHGITPVRIGFDVGQLVHEFAVLRRVIHGLAAERGLSLAEDGEPLAVAIEEAVSTAVRAYMQARDYEARRRQAETIGFLTHELRNPLSAAMLSAAQVRRRLGGAALQALDTLDRSHVRLSQLIDSVLLTEKLEAGVRSNPVRMTLGELMPTCLEGAERVARAKGLLFDVHYQPSLVVQVDPMLTRSAVQNIVDNAAKYTDDGGVCVDVEERPEHIVVHVRDSCVGISAEELKTVFEPFRRGATDKDGTGLGLAIARRAVETQGGSIDAESTGHSGCHFWIQLPKQVVAVTATGH